jgi:hypothetical protein
MHTKKLILFTAGTLFVTGFFFLPANRKWAEKLVGYYKDFPYEIRHTSKDDRMKARFGNSYTISKIIGHYFIQRNLHRQSLVLMPPTSYFKKQGISYHVPEPAVFYYYTGLKTIWANSPKAIEANWYVHVHQGKLVIEPVTDKKALQDTIAMFNKMGVSL